MRAQSIAMSRAVDLCVNALERAASAEGESVGAERAGMMALTALKHVRDVLGGQAHAFDPAVIEPLTLALSVPEEKVRDEEPNADATPAPVPVAPVASAKATSPTAAPSASSTSANGLSAAPVASPPLHLSARTDKPLPSLSRTPPVHSPPLASAVLPAPGVTRTPSYPPPPAGLPHAQPPKQKAPPPTNPSLPSTGFSVRSPALAPSANANAKLGLQARKDEAVDPLGALLGGKGS